MHTAKINRIAIDAQERYLVTASDDKTARVWNLHSGALLQILRPPISEGNEGKLYAVAMSPDGTEVAVGGFTGRAGSPEHIYLFDRISGRLQRHIAALPNVVTHLAYSSDGQFLAAALFGLNGIRVYGTANLQEVAADKAYSDSSYWLDFDHQGHLVSSSDDGFIRLYSPQFQLLHKQALTDGKQPFAVRFSPDGHQIAVGFYDSTKVNVLSANDLHLAYAPDTQGVDNGNLGTVAWSADGQTLYAGGRYDDGSGISPLLSWPQAGRGAAQRVGLASNTVMDFLPLRDRGLVYGTGAPAWGLLDGNHKLLEKTALITDYRSADPINSLHLNPTASVLRFTANAAAPRLFDLNQQAYRQNGTDSLSAAKTTTSAYSVTDWQNQLTPAFNRQPLKLEPNERSRSLAISADNGNFLLGTEWRLRYFDQQGYQQWEATTPGVAWAVNLSADGRVAVAAFADGTIRWYSTQDGKEQLAFFPHADGQRWVLWTPEGFYAASPGAEELIGYHLNQGDDKEGLFISAQQLGKRFYRPDLIAQRLNGNEQGIQTALREIGDIRQVLAQGLPPQLTLLSNASSHQTNPDYTVEFQIADQGGGIGNIVYKVNGSVLDGRPVGTGVPGHRPLKRQFALASGVNSVEILAYDAANKVASRALSTTVQVDQPQLPVTLHVLALGISDYRDRALKLTYADKDAQAMTAALQQNGQGLFDKLNILPPLLNRDATLANLQAKFKTLAASVQPQDVFILYLAGHGQAIDGNYHFAPWETVIKNDDSLRTGSLDEEGLRGLLAQIVATKTVVLLDTCAAGAFTMRRGIEQKTAMSRLMRATGRAVLAATADDNMALEGYEQHGVFTYALLEGLKNADTNHNAQIEIGELADYVEAKVPEITLKKWGYEQFPMRDLQGMSFAVGKKL
jgi:WD40 repeat protein